MSDVQPLKSLNRRTLLAGSLAALGALALPRGAAAAPPGPDLLDAETMWRWVERMAACGPRFTGSPAHRRWIDSLAAELASFGLEVERFPTPLKYWNARDWSLTVTEATGETHRIPVAYYWPYSGTTPAEGITGLVADAAGGADLTGRIAMVDRPVTKLVAGVFAPVTVTARPRTLLLDSAFEDISRLWLGATGEKLSALRERGALAAISILPFAPEDARGQYTPHQQPQDGLPGLHLDREQGARLRAMLARGPVTATLTLTADTDPFATIDYLVATVPGNGNKPGAVLLMTHTDGQNAIEENGAAAVLAMADYFTKIPVGHRDRDICVVFSPTHMTSSSSGVHPDRWLEQHPEIRDRIVAAVVPEHLGALQWDSGADGSWQATGAPEMLVLGVGNNEQLTGTVAAALDSSDLDRTIVARPYTNNLYGEATGPFRLGIPTVTAIAGPNYLIRVSPGGELDRLDPVLAHRQTRFLTGLTEQLLRAPWLPGPR
ncbi:hypothetical protein ABZ319_36260 [Nocardia sp. NPDC005978]|uniref:hypothetical protein n=1 Tax=Nocardia sp. NPDC005978 TaxID=3156725 RepID=UPI00339E1E23